MVFFARLSVAFGLSVAATAATLPAGPNNAQTVIMAAQSGDTVQLAAGNYLPIVIKNRQWDQPVIVDASAAQLQSVELRTVNNIVWRGGSFDGASTERYGFVARASQNVAIENGRFSHYFRAGIVFDHVSGGRIAGNLFSNMASDGADVALSDHVVIDGNECRDFLPAPLAHPDCIQAWSRPTVPPTSDLTITNNRMTGLMQGISLFNHVQGGVDDGGFDRIVISGNIVRVSYPNGISAMDCRGCTIRDNVVDGVAGGSVRAKLRFDRSDITACNNDGSVVIGALSEKRCRRNDR